MKTVIPTYQAINTPLSHTMDLRHRTGWWQQTIASQLSTSTVTQFFLGLTIASALTFLFSALAGLWVTYDRIAGLGRLGLLATGLLLVLLLTWSAWRTSRQGDDPLQIYRIIGLDSGMMAGGIGLLFLLTHNWQEANVTDFTVLPQLTAWIQARQPLWGEGILLHENLVAGALILLLPIAIVTLWQLWQTPERWYRTPLRYWSLAGVAMGTVALLLTFSRSAWLGFVGGLAVALYLHWRTDSEQNERRAKQRQHLARHYQFAERHGRRPPSRLQRWLDFLLEDPIVVDWTLALGALVAIALLVGITLSPWLHEFILRPIAGTYLEGTVNSRLAAWQEALPVLQDYPFTGSGLGSTAMVLASYVYLLHVPYLYHAHSLYLQVAIEQGLPGLIGLVGMIAGTVGLAWIWLRQGTVQERLYAGGALAAQLALLIYGATDAELYVGIFVPFLFLPTALLLACVPHAVADINRTEAPTEEIESTPVLIKSTVAGITVGTLPILIALLVLFLWPGAEARWLANQATVDQTRQELALYSWPTWPLQDAVRRSDLVQTERRQAQYEAVLRLNPTNVTALRRLGQIKLSLGDYTQAEQHLSAAYQQAPHQRPIRQLLGEVKALLGDQQAAATLWQDLDISQGQPALRLWWYEHADGSAAAAPFALFLEQQEE